MRAISTWEPWATLIRLGLKKCEIRSWKTNYRGELLICAAKGGLTKREVTRLLNYWRNVLPDKIAGQIPFTLNHGYAVAVVRLESCHPTELFPVNTDLSWGFDPRLELRFREKDFSLGRYFWKLDLLDAIEPFPVTGRRGFFDVNLPRDGGV